MTVADCGLLEHYYETSNLNWSIAKQSAVDGHSILVGNPINAICKSWVDAFLPLLDPFKGCNGAVPDEMRFNAETNPDGVRCTIQDGNVNIFGRDPKTGYARRPLDTTGVQYGIKALRDGTISADEFLDVNRNIGGFSINGEYIPHPIRTDQIRKEDVR